MSDESLSSAGGIVVEELDSTPAEYRLSEDEMQIIQALNERQSYTNVPTEPLDLTSLALSNVSTFEDQSRIVIDVTDGSYEIELYETTPDPYQRSHLSAVFLNGKQIELRESGLELFGVTVFIYRTEENQHIASLWTQK